MYVMYVCYVCMLCMYVRYVCYVCMLCMYVMYVCYVCMLCMYVMYVCYVCMLCMYVMYVCYVFTILTAIVQGVLEPGRIDVPYALDAGRKWTLSEQILTYCSPIEKLQLGEESDRCEQNVNKQLLAESAAYFGFKKLIKLEKTYYLCTLIG